MIQFKNLRTSFGTRQILWKLVFLIGIIFRAAFLLLIIFCGAVYFRITSDYVWVVAGLMRILIICSCIVTCFGSICNFFHRSHFQPLTSILSFKWIMKASSVSDASFMIFLHMGDMKWKKTVTFSSIMSTPYINYSTQLVFSSPKNLRFNNNNNKNKEIQYLLMDAMLMLNTRKRKNRERD